MWLCHQDVCVLPAIPVSNSYCPLLHTFSSYCSVDHKHSWNQMRILLYLRSSVCGKNIRDGVHVHDSSSCASCPHVLVLGTVCVVEHLPPWVCCLHASCELMLHCWPQFSLSVVLFDPVTPSGISHLFFNPSYRRQRPLRPHKKRENSHRSPSCGP